MLEGGETDVWRAGGLMLEGWGTDVGGLGD